MTDASGDIQNVMGADSKGSGPTEAPVGGPERSWEAMAPREFSLRLEPIRQTLWLTAAGVLGHPDEAEDVVQEAAVIGLQKLGDFEPSTSFTAWMAQIVRNVARNHARKRRRRRTAATDPAEIDNAGANGIASPVRDEEFDASLMRALNELDEAPRTCLLLRTLRDMSYREISEVLGIPEGTAMSHVHRARQALRARLTDAAGEGDTR